MRCSPSFLSCDFSRLEEEIKSISEAKWLHFDVMDGRFVGNTTYDASMLIRLKPITHQFFDCHLMIESPEDHVQSYIDAGADLVTFHFEATDDPLSLLKRIRRQKQNIKAGISIKPETDVRVLDPLLKDLDLVLIMSVEPGKGGQAFLESAPKKIKYLNQKRNSLNVDFLIEVDGGINLDTAKIVKDAGCDVIVVGSFIFNQNNRNEMIKELENV